MVVGAASRDLDPSDPRGWRLGGAVTYAGLALARLGLRPRVLLGGDAGVMAAGELELLRAAGAELRPVELARSPIFDNREVDGIRAQHCLEPGDPLPAEALPSAWRSAAHWILGPVADELGDDWASVPPADAWVALGWQGLLRDLPRGGPVARRPPRAGPLPGRADLVVVSRLDLDAGARVGALAGLLRDGAWLVVTDGEAGGEAWRVGDGRLREGRRYGAIPAASVVDATGAGDAFLAGLVAARLGHPLAGRGGRDDDLRLAAALGSLAVEAPGVLGVPSSAAAEARLRGPIRRD